jgi:putative oxidoreductase
MGASKAASDVAAGLGKLVLRLTLGGLTLFHGVSKLMGGPASIVGLVERAGLPPSFGYLVYVGEVLAPLLIIIGLWTRAAAGVIAINMMFAVYLVHRAELFTLSKSGGWALELQGFYFFVAVAVMLLGAGQYSVGGRHGRLN